MLLGDVLDEQGSLDDFVGHPGGDNFIIITTKVNADGIIQGMKTRFAEQVLTHYNFMDREQGYILSTGDDGKAEHIPLMNISVGMISPETHQFSDIREITELAADARRKDTVGA